MKIKSFEFNLRELAGSLGDFGTLLPLAIGYIYVCGLNPAGFLVMLGLANIVTGLVYRLPMPIEPMKVLAVVAIAQHWSPSLVYASAFAMGIVWVLFAATGMIGWLAKITPEPVVRGIQVALGVLLALEAYRLLSAGWVLGIAAIAIVLVLRDNRYAPAAIVLVALGLVMVFMEGKLAGISPPGFSLPPVTTFTIEEVWDSLVLAGFAQIPLTVTNATIATAALIRSYWPDRPVTEKQLSWNQGIMNLAVPFLGGMPMCHGAGGLAGQYYFGARTGGANILEGLIEIAMGLFLAASIAGLFSVFPAPIIGAMMLMVGIELTKFARRIRPGREMFALGATVAVTILSNMAWGFVAGLAMHHLVNRLSGTKA